jgi:hypothetical protein
MGLCCEILGNPGEWGGIEKGRFDEEKQGIANRYSRLAIRAGETIRFIEHCQGKEKRNGREEKEEEPLARVRGTFLHV